MTFVYKTYFLRAKGKYKYIHIFISKTFYSNFKCKIVHQGGKHLSVFTCLSVQISVLYHTQHCNITETSFSYFTCHPCTGAMLIFSVTFQLNHVLQSIMLSFNYSVDIYVFFLPYSKACYYALYFILTNILSKFYFIFLNLKNLLEWFLGILRKEFQYFYFLYYNSRLYNSQTYNTILIMKRKYVRSWAHSIDY